MDKGEVIEELLYVESESHWDWPKHMDIKYILQFHVTKGARQGVANNRKCLLWGEMVSEEKWSAVIL